ncbi:hypothetical protein VTJ04DRAFT_10617 [Mycothermus thermophilus]|uniref:uncharacterized protein n=1 Tax=Humicola insolens TaxID=85995 RepID=UPI0037436B4A
MADPSNTSRPSSRAYYASAVPPASPRPQSSVVARGSRSSLRHDAISGHPAPPASTTTYSPPNPVPEGAPPIADDDGGVPIHSSPPPPPFSPIFTLISSTSQSTNKQTIHYPTVHYIFADDDPEYLSAALAHHHGSAQAVGDETETNNPDIQAGGSGSRTPPDRGVLLEVEPTADGSGYEVVWASSLTPDWAATSARLTRSGETSGGLAAGGLGGNLVLKIDGVSLDHPPPRPQGKAAAEAEMQASGTVSGRQQSAPTADEYPELLKEFERRMTTLRKVVEAGAARQRAIDHGSFQPPPAPPPPPASGLEEAEATTSGQPSV